jgi:hypothetical protein
MAVPAMGFDQLAGVASLPSTLASATRPRLRRAAAGVWGAQLDPIDTVDCHYILIVSVKMRVMVRCASFPVHADYDTEETADFWLESILA